MWCVFHNWYSYNRLVKKWLVTPDWYAGADPPTSKTCVKCGKTKTIRFR